MIKEYIQTKLDEHGLTFKEWYLNGEKGIQPCPCFQVNDHDGEFEEIESELKKDGSWLIYNDNYQFIRSLVLSDKIAIFREDIISSSWPDTLVDILNSNDEIIDTLYLSNVRDYCTLTEQYYTIKTLCHKDVKIIWCSGKDDLKQHITDFNGYYEYYDVN